MQAFINIQIMIRALIKERGEAQAGPGRGGERGRSGSHGEVAGWTRIADCACADLRATSAGQPRGPLRAASAAPGRSRVKARPPGGTDVPACRALEPRSPCCRRPEGRRRPQAQDASGTGVQGTRARRETVAGPPGKGRWPAGLCAGGGGRRCARLDVARPRPWEVRAVPRAQMETPAGSFLASGSPRSQGQAQPGTRKAQSSRISRHPDHSLRPAGWLSPGRPQLWVPKADPHLGCPGSCSALPGRRK